MHKHVDAKNTNIQTILSIFLSLAAEFDKPCQEQEPQPAHS